MLRPQSIANKGALPVHSNAPFSRSGVSNSFSDSNFSYLQKLQQTRRGLHQTRAKLNHNNNNSNNNDNSNSNTLFQTNSNSSTSSRSSNSNSHNTSRVTDSTGLQICRNILLSQYGKSPKDACRFLLDMMPALHVTPDVSLYNLVLNIVESRGVEEKVELAEKVWTDMREKGVPPNLETYNLMLRSFGKNEEKRYKSVELWEQLKADGIEPTIEEYRMAVRAFNRDDARAMEVVAEMKEKGVPPDGAVYVSVISACTRGGKLKEALSFFEEMKGAGLRPNARIYEKLIVGCSGTEAFVPVIDQLWKEMTESGVTPTPAMSAARRKHFPDLEKPKSPTRTTAKGDDDVNAQHRVRRAIQKARDSGDLKRAVRLTEEARGKLGEKLEMKTFNTMINVYLQTGQMDKVAELLRHMAEVGMEPNLTTYNILIEGSWKLGNDSMAIQLFSDMTKKGLGDSITLATMVKWYIAKNRVQDAIDVYTEMKTRGIIPPLPVLHTLLGACEKNGKVELVPQLFREISETRAQPSSETTTTTTTEKDEKESQQQKLYYQHCISEAAQLGDREQVERMFEEIWERQIGHPLFRYHTMLQAYVRLGDLVNMRKLVEEMRKEGVPLSLRMYHALLQGSWQLGDETTATQIFTEMKESGRRPPISIYNIMISGHAKHQQLERALELFHEMQEAGLVPDYVTYTILIDVFWKAGKGDEATDMFERMLQKGVAPTVVTCGCMLRGLFGSGQFHRAEELFEGMKAAGVEPNVNIYNIMLQGLWKQGKETQALEIYKKLLNNNSRLTPDDTTYRTMVSGYLRVGKTSKAVEFVQQLKVQNIDCQWSRRMLDAVAKATQRPQSQRAESRTTADTDM